MPEIPVKSTVDLKDGTYKGQIVELIYRGPAYEQNAPKERPNYVDIMIQESETEQTVKCGVPANITPTSYLGALLMRFGVKLQEHVGKSIDPTPHLINKMVQFLVVNKKKTTDQGTFDFATVLHESIKPVEEGAQDQPTPPQTTPPTSPPAEAPKTVEPKVVSQQVV